MNVQIPFSFVREYVDTDATAEEVYKWLSLCGPSIEKIIKTDEDAVFDVEITANRIDTAGVYGFARELAAIVPQFGKKALLRPFGVSLDKTSVNDNLLYIEDQKKLVNRICAVVVDVTEINNSAPYIAKRLELAGVRSINNIVDITNYVMLEVGHPVHAFDYDRLSTGKLIFRYARKGENLTTLEDKTYQLCEDDIIIDDSTGRIVDLPGIIGTSNSVITKDTKRVIFFVESNNRYAIRKTSMTHAIRTLAATFNEKGPDSELAIIALLRSRDLAVSEYGAKQASGIIDINHVKNEQKIIQVAHADIEKIIGDTLEVRSIADILSRLGFGVHENKGLYDISVPTWRKNDVEIPQDIVEEIARIYGYFNIPAKVQKTDIIEQPEQYERMFTYLFRIKNLLKHVGAHELYTYSLISKDLMDLFGEDSSLFLRLNNSISTDIEYLRTSLIPSVFAALYENRGYKSNATFFEIANVYHKKNKSLPDEKRMITIATTKGFYYLAGLIRLITQDIHAGEVQFIQEKHRFFDPQESARLEYSDGTFLGHAGNLSAKIASKKSYKTVVSVCELDFEVLVARARLIHSYTPYTQYAVIKRDITLQLSGSTPFSWHLSRFAALTHLIKWELIDMYNEKVTVRLYFGDLTQNLTEKQVDEYIKNYLS